MSQSSKGHVRAKLRERERVARFLHRIDAVQPCGAALGVACFDVHAARKSAQSLIDSATVRADLHYSRGRVQAAQAQDGAIRLGRAVLRALAGQPSECGCCVAAPSSCMVVTASGSREWVSKGQRVVFVTDAAEALRTATTLGALVDANCPTCHGTGHNLRGVLPAIEWSPQVRRKVREAEIARGESNQQRDGWTHTISVPALLALYTDLARDWCPPNHKGAWSPLSGFARLARTERRLTMKLPPLRADFRVGRLDTRVVPRGEHRNDLEPGSVSWMPRESPILWQHNGRVRMRYLAPRWRRGEREHDGRRLLRREHLATGVRLDALGHETSYRARLLHFIFRAEGREHQADHVPSPSSG